MKTEEWTKISYYVEALSEEPDNNQIFEKLEAESTKLKKEVHSLLKSINQSSHLFNKSPFSDSVAIKLDDSTSEVNFKSGDKINQYQIIRTIGEGGFSTVYLAEDTYLERTVALKVSYLKGDEAQTLARLNHPNIVTIYEEFLFEKNGTEFSIIAMQPIVGRDFHAYIREEEHPALLNMALQIVKALKYAHSQSVLHLDIKPDNIIVDDTGHVYVMDFNVSSKDKAKPRGGTKNYMSPELQKYMDGDFSTKVSEKSDVYSFGKLFIQRKLSKDFKSLINICLHAEEDKRWSNFYEIEVALKRIIRNEKLKSTLPKLSVVGQFIKNHPGKTIILFALFPQIMGSVFNIIYNQSYVVASLDALKLQAFQESVVYYNIVIYPLCIFLFYRRVSKTLGNLPQAKQDFTANEFKESINRDAAFQNSSYGLNRYFFYIVCFGWLPGIVFFPLMVSVETLKDFAISISASWLIAASYSFLALNYWFYQVCIGRSKNLSNLRNVIPKPTLLSSLSYQALAVVPLLLLFVSILVTSFNPSLDNELQRSLHLFLAAIGVLGSSVGFWAIQTINKFQAGLSA